MISVVIPLYNKEAHIAKTLDSVLNQTYQNFEIIVVDDGSTDNSSLIAKSFADSRIRIISQPNGGVSAARNRGTSEAIGEYIAFLDADDLWLPSYLETQIKLLAKYPNCDVFATNYIFRDSEGKTSPTIIRNILFDGPDGILTNYFQVASSSHSPLWTSAVMVKKNAIKEIGGFPKNIKSGEDLLTWAKLAVKYNIAYSRSPQAVFNQTSFRPIEESKSKIRFGGEMFVLSQLFLLYDELPTDSPMKHGLKLYIHRWQRIACILCIESGNNQKLIPVAWKAIRFGAPLWQMVILLAFGILPSKIASSLFLKLRR